MATEKIALVLEAVTAKFRGELVAAGQSVQGFADEGDGAWMSVRSRSEHRPRQRKLIQPVAEAQDCTEAVIDYLRGLHAACREASAPIHSFANERWRRGSDGYVRREIVTSTTMG